jgi:hypothetical protein
MAKIVSPKYSLKGWEFKKWVLGNASTIKELVKVGVPYLISTYFTANPIFAIVITGAGKMVLDTIEYWAKEYTV